MVVDVSEMEIEHPQKNRNTTTVRYKREELFFPLIALASKNAIR